MPRIVEDVDPSEPAPSTMNPAASIPENRRDTQTFASSVALRSNSRFDESVGTVADFAFTWLLCHGGSSARRVLARRGLTRRIFSRGVFSCRVFR